MIINEEMTVFEMVREAQMLGKPIQFKNVKDKIRITYEDISSMFRDRFLLERESFFMVDKKTGGIDSSIYLADYKLEALAIRDGLKSGNVVSVKHLETFNQDIIDTCSIMSDTTNLHMYATPRTGESFAMHKDDRHVYIKVLFGEKILVCIEDGEEVAYHLKKGDWFHIPFAVDHRAITHGPAISFSFGAIETDKQYVDHGVTVEDLTEVFGAE